MKLKYVIFINLMASLITYSAFGQLNLDIEGFGTISERLGIGTSFPDEKLEVQGSGTITRIGVTTTTNHNATFRARTPLSDFAWYADGDENAFKLYDFNAGLDRFTINEVGNVGIGTTSFSNRLVVVDDRDDNYIYTVIRNNGNGGTGLWLYNDNNTEGSTKIIMRNVENTTARYWAIGNDRTDGNKLKIAASSSIEGQSQFVIDRDGNVGIGLTDPITKFHLKETVPFEADTEVIYARFENNDHVIDIQSEFSATTIPPNGVIMRQFTKMLPKVVGSESAIHQFYIGDEDNPWSNIYSANFYAASSSNYNTYSDKRLKSNIKSIKNGLDIILKLQPKTYDILQTG